MIFERALFQLRVSSESRRVAHARTDQVESELRTLRELSASKRKAGMALTARAQPAWLVDLTGRVLAAGDVHDAIDEALELLAAQPDDWIRFPTAIADHFQGHGDRTTAVHYLNVAAESVDDALAETRTELARRLVAAGVAPVAMDLLVSDALGHAGEALAPTLLAAYQRTRAAEDARLEHGHELLLAYLKIYLPTLKAAVLGAQQMVEVGTTRENVLGQGSTRKLADDVAPNLGIRFTTVDMDLHNSRNAAIRN